MAPRSPILFTFFSIFALAVPIFAVSRGAIVGGWKPIADPNNPEVVMVAKFAVTEHNKEAHESLVFVSVVKGESQIVAGKNYRLVISARGGGNAKPKAYRATVYYKPWKKFLQLLSFEEIKG